MKCQGNFHSNLQPNHELYTQIYKMYSTRPELHVDIRSTVQLSQHASRSWVAQTTTKHSAVTTQVQRFTNDEKYGKAVDKASCKDLQQFAIITVSIILQVNDKSITKQAYFQTSTYLKSSVHRPLRYSSLLLIKYHCLSSNLEV